MNLQLWVRHRFPSAWTSVVAFVFCLALAPQSFLCGQSGEPTELSGFDSNELYAVEDGTELELDNEFLTRLLFRVHSSSRRVMRRFAEFSNGVTDAELIEDPQKYRFWVFQRKAIATTAKPFGLPATIATEEVDRLWVTLAAAGDQKYIFISQNAPKPWSKKDALNKEPVGITGFYFGMQTLNRMGVELSVPVFVSKNIQWFPNREISEENIRASQLLLARNGVDLNCIDLLKRKGFQSLSAEESPYFNQFLAAVDATEQGGELPDIVPVDFIDLFTQSGNKIGDYVEIEGTVRRVVPVQISEKLQAELGLPCYYELDMFVSLKDLPKITIRNSEGEKVEERNRFPIMVNVPRLPGKPEDYKNKRVRVKGFFYRFWRFSSKHAEEVGFDDGQVSPLVIGFDPRLVPAAAGDELDTILTVAAIGLLGFILLLIYVFRSSDRNSNHRLNQAKELPEKVEIDFDGPRND